MVDGGRVAVRIQIKELLTFYPDLLTQKKSLNYTKEYYINQTGRNQLNLVGCIKKKIPEEDDESTGWAAKIL